MKKILIIITVLGIAVMAACKKDSLITVSQNIKAPVLTAPKTDTAVVVNAADTANIIHFSWTAADFGVSGITTYFVQIDSAGNNFKKFVSIATTSNTTNFQLSLNSLNSQLLSGLALKSNAATSLEIRVGATLYGKDTTYSKIVKLALTTFKVLVNGSNKLWLPGSYEGYSPATAQTIYQQAPNVFEGYVTFSASGNFKFTNMPDYSHTIYGDGGNGTLTTAGNPADILFGSAGVYLVDANTSALTYSDVLINSMGIIGPATPQGWNASTAMTYLGNYKWSITLNLLGNNPLKFRANDAWDINYGPADSNALNGTLKFNDPGAITIPADGNYTVTINMAQATTNGYTYTIVKN